MSLSIKKLLIRNNHCSPSKCIHFFRFLHEGFWPPSKKNLYSLTSRDYLLPNLHIFSAPALVLHFIQTTVFWDKLGISLIKCPFKPFSIIVTWCSRGSRGSSVGATWCRETLISRDSWPSYFFSVWYFNVQTFRNKKLTHVHHRTQKPSKWALATISLGWMSPTRLLAARESNWGPSETPWNITSLSYQRV